MRIHGRALLGSALAALVTLSVGDAQAGKPRPQPLPLSAYVRLDAVLATVQDLADDDPAAVAEAALAITGKAAVLSSKLRISGDLAVVQNGQELARGSFDAVTSAAIDSRLDPPGGRVCVVLDGKVTDGRRFEALHKEACQDLPSLP